MSAYRELLGKDLEAAIAAESQPAIPPSHFGWQVEQRMSQPPTGIPHIVDKRGDRPPTVLDIGYGTGLINRPGERFPDDPPRE